MKNGTPLTNAQQEDLLIEWNLYTPSQQQPFIDEFHAEYGSDDSQEQFLHFLRKKLAIDGYWRKTGLLSD